MTKPESLFDLAGKIAVVTGAAGLLGFRHAIALAHAGASVVLTDLKDDCDVSAIETADRQAVLYLRADLTVKEDVRKLRDRILDEFGTLDILLNNAAMNDMAEHRSEPAVETAFEHYSLDQWNRSLAVNVTGTFLCCQILGTVMARQGSGSIINIASTYGIVAPDQSIYLKPNGERLMYKSPAYPATKGAVLALTRYLAAYWGSAGVRVNALSPGGVQNGQDEFFIRNYSSRTMLGRMASPDDYEGAVIFLASDASRYMTGANLIVDGGWTAW